ncbi:MAG TPA: hypothetical protein VKZ41_03655 [Gemmatimonadales bacterium]|nr:hypothetical protein [Gemmatimonadales bacterium]
MNRSTLAAACATLLLASLGCSSGSDGESASSASSASAPGATAGAVELTDANLAALERGLREELVVIRSPGRGSHYGVSLSEHSPEAGQVAAAAGISVEEYREIREVVERVFTTLNFQGKIGPPRSIDLDNAGEEFRMRLESDPFNELSQGSAAALRSRMDTLAPVWSEIVSQLAQNG